jgi:outer membrane lipoprotein
MRKRLIMVLPILLILTGCAHWISEQSRELADRRVIFSHLSETPDAYRGKYVMLGGVVAAVKRGRDGTQLEVIQHNIVSRDLPDVSVPSGGRFLATTPEFLDPERYGPGTLVTLVGKVTGREVHELQGREYFYPVVAITEIHDIVIQQETEWGYYGGM